MKPSDFLTELSTDKLAQYKTAAAADASKADKEGNFKKGDKRFKGINTATKKQFDNDEKKVEEGVGLPSPGTYEETNDMFKSSGQRRIGTLTTEDDQIDGMAQGEIREIIKNAIHIKNQLDKGVSLDGWMYSYVTTSNDHLNSVAEQINNPNIDEQALDEACWKGYHKEGNKKMFGKTYPNCVKNTNEEQELDEYGDTPKGQKMLAKVHHRAVDRVTSKKADTDPKYAKKNQDTANAAYDRMTEEHHSESCPHCGGELVSEELMNEKKDACYYKVKSRYKVWPSAYASGALVKCRKKGASNWGTGGKSNESVVEGAPELLKQEMPLVRHIEQELAQHGYEKGTPEYDQMFKHTMSMYRKFGNVDAIKRSVAEGSLNEGQYEMMMRNGQVKKFIAKDDADAKRIAAGHGAKSVIRLRGGVPAGKIAEQDVAEDQLDEKWTKKYKDSINCSNPKGFSQKAHCAGKKKNESSILEGLEQVDENLHQWFKEKWVRFGPDGKIRGACARGDDSEGKPKCLPQSKAQNLGKKGRASAAARKRREDPNPERSGKAINVNTKKKN